MKDKVVGVLGYGVLRFLEMCGGRVMKIFVFEGGREKKKILGFDVG